MHYMLKLYADSAFYELSLSGRRNTRETIVEARLSNWFKVSAMIQERQLPTS